MRKLIFATASLMMFGGFISCSDDDDTVAPPSPLGGYISSDSVAPNNLKSYFPFEGNANDVKGGTNGTTVGGVTFTAGRRGQAYQGIDGGYALVPASANFSNLPSYSFSIWYKITQQPVAGSPEGLFFLSGATTQNELIYEIENYSPVSGDSVRIHHGFNDLASPAWQLFVMQSFNTAAINTWNHLVTTYDATSSVYTVYQNGVAIGNQSAFSSGGYITPTPMWTDGSATTPLGALGFASDPPSQIILGTWPAGLFGVSPNLGDNGSFLGQMDEIRVFNKALTSAEVNGLYLNGNAGR
jgi:hypothetical protein